MKRPSRRTVLLSLFALLFVSTALCGLSIFLSPDAPDPEPTAQAAAVIEERAGLEETVPAAATIDDSEATSTARPSRPPRPTTAPTDEPTNKPPATAAPTRTPRPSATPAPSRTPSRVPTATPIPQPTTTPIPPTPAPPTAPPPTATRSGVDTATVTAVIDGDTIEVNLNGTIYRVRYIGIDTPETGAICGSEATAANAALVSGRTVTMVRDVSETDRYGRLLRYVFVGNTFVNGALVSGGWADAVDYPPDTAQSAALHSLATQGNGRGCDLVAAPLPTQPVRAPEATLPLATAPAPTVAPPAGNCDASYPDVCIPPPPPDLDCKDIPHRRFRVLPPDPHNFDGNADGVGCEG